MDTSNYKPREYFFLGPDGNDGVKFKTGNIPPEFTFKELLNSIWFKLDPVPSDDEAVRTREKITNMNNIVLNGIYWGDNIINGPTDKDGDPVKGRVNIIAYKDPIGNYTYILSFPENNKFYFGTKLKGGYYKYIDFSEEEEDPGYSDYRTMNPNDIGLPQAGHVFVGHGLETGIHFLWIKDEHGNVVRIMEDGGGGTTPVNRKEYYFVVDHNTQSDFVLDEEVVLATAPEINGVSIPFIKNNYIVSGDTISFTPPLLMGDHLLIVNTY